MRKRCFAFSLLELLLVISVISSLALFGAKRYQQWRHESEIIALQQNVALLSQAVMNYYDEKCRANEIFTVDVDKLKQAGLWPNMLDEPNRLVSHYFVSAKKIGTTKETEKPVYQLEVTTMLAIQKETLRWYKNRLDATESSPPNILTWINVPGYSIPHMNDNLWVMNAQLRAFKEENTPDNDISCPG